MKKNISLFLSVFLLLSVFAFSEKDKEDPFLINIKPAKLTSLKKEAFSWLDAHMTELCEINDKIWHFAEVAMEEYQSSELLASYLGKMGFKVTRNVAGMPTAFVAVYGSGEPVIGILAEYDALPGLSQQAVPYEKPFKAGASGHGCGHNIFGTSSTAAAVAIKQLMEKKGIEGTVKLFGCPVEVFQIRIYKRNLGISNKNNSICTFKHTFPRGLIKNLSGNRHEQKMGLKLMDQACFYRKQIKKKGPFQRGLKTQ